MPSLRTTQGHYRLTENSHTCILEANIPSSYAGLDHITGMVSQAICHAPVSEDDAVDLTLATVEAVTNAIHHGNAEDETKQVHIQIETTPDQITVWVRDEGAGFCIKKVPNPCHSENLLKDSGRGILMMQAFMDRVEFYPEPDGTIVKMTKHLNADTSQKTA